MGINSFGFGGTNAHAVIQEYRARRNGNSAGKAVAPGERMRVLIISARTIEALRAMASDYAKLLAASGAPALDAICASAALRRSRLPIASRLAVRTRERLLSVCGASRAAMLRAALHIAA